ncbi:MAG: hypothetical protein P8L80_03145 [Flavobacteriales bacterium]|nr:hypothetical protein [Flavobacteriales bacterium]
MELRFFIFNVFVVLGILSCSFANAQYSLVVETKPSVSTEMLRYHIYIKFKNPTDRLSAIYGTNIDHMWIEAPEGVFNSPFNGGWSAAGLNSQFFAAMPTLQDDSYATINLTASAFHSPEGSQDPMMVEDRGSPWATFFTENGATRLDINTLIGGSWFALKSASNGLPDKNNRILIAQITTSGSLSGEINAQIFPLGNGKNSMKVKFTFDGIGETKGVEVLR